MGVIALGKFENKLSEAGVIGFSAKQEFLGFIFSPTLHRTTGAQPQVPSSSSKRYSLLPSPPLVAL